MKKLFAVIRSRGPGWDGAGALEEQPGWRAHADFMDARAADGFLLLVGPLEGTEDVLAVARARDEAEVRSRLAEDPWSRSGLLRISLVAPWQLRIGSLD